MRLLIAATLLLGGCATPADERADSLRAVDSASARSTSPATVDTTHGAAVNQTVPPKPSAPARPTRPVTGRDSVIGHDRALEIDIRDRSKQFPPVTDTARRRPAPSHSDTLPATPR